MTDRHLIALNLEVANKLGVAEVSRQSAILFQSMSVGHYGEFRSNVSGIEVAHVILTTSTALATDGPGLTGLSSSHS